MKNLKLNKIPEIGTSEVYYDTISQLVNHLKDNELVY